METRPEGMAPLVRLRDVARSFREGERDHRVLSGVELEVRRGEVVVVVGPSGSGKSTLLNLLSGIDLPDRGDIEIDGRVLNRLSERERTLFRRHHIGFVFQFFNLIPTLTVAENVLLPLELGGRATATGWERARSLLEAVGLADRAASRPDRLSGGEQQRVAIARALVHEPELVLADEPTGNLDHETGDRVAALLDRLVRGTGRTLVLVTHSGRLLRLADRVLTLDRGRLEESPLPGDAGVPGYTGAGARPDGSPAASER